MATIATKATSKSIATVMEVLTTTPLRFASFIKDLSDEQRRQPLTLGEWSLQEVIVHVYNVARVSTDRIYHAGLAENPTIPYIHPQRDLSTHLQLEQVLSLDEIFTMYRLERLTLLGVLNRLRTDDWVRPFTLQEREHSIYSEARRIASHEIEHIEDAAPKVATLLLSSA